MRRPYASTALAASALVAVTLASAAASAPKPRRDACGAAPAGTTRVDATPKRVSARAVGLPKTIDMRDVPKVPESAPATSPPPQMPSHAIGKAKAPTVAACVPQATPLPGNPAGR